MIRKKVLLILLGLFSFGVLYAQISASKALQNALSHISEKKSIMIDFSSSDLGLSGKLTTFKGEKYKLEIGSRTIICDGKSLWNYDQSQKQVIISDYDPENTELALDRLLFKFKDFYKATQISEYYSSEMSKSKSDKLYKLKLIPKSVDNLLFDITGIKLFLTKKDQSLKGIELIQNSQQVFIKINELRVIKKKVNYNFKEPEDTEVIDMRG